MIANQLSDFYIVSNAKDEVWCTNIGFKKVVAGIFESGQVQMFTPDEASQFLNNRGADDDQDYRVLRVEVEYCFMEDNLFQSKEREAVLKVLTPYQRRVLGL